MQPTAFGHYRIDARIGEGGMGEVFRAFDTKLNRSVAIKVMRRAGDGDLPIERFLREARAASALNHPNPSGRSMMFSGLMSRCISPAACAAATPS